MLRNIIKYGGLALVIIGIIIVMKNLFTSDANWENSKKNKNKDSYYSAKISLLDKETNAFIIGASLVVKDEAGTIVSGWTTEEGVHLITNLKQGTYTLVQENASSDYHLNSDIITFEINGKDEEVVMYNIKMTEEEIKNAANGSQISNEVGVENTLSTKGIFGYIAAIICVGFGATIILKTKKEMN